MNRYGYKASYTKLKDETWGAKIEGAVVSPGSAVTVTKKNGEEKEEVVEKVLWEGTGGDGRSVYICKLASPAAKGRMASRGAHPRTGCSCGSREGLMQKTDCAQCRFDEWDC